MTLLIAMRKSMLVLACVATVMTGVPTRSSATIAEDLAAAEQRAEQARLEQAKLDLEERRLDLEEKKYEREDSSYWIAAIVLLILSGGVLLMYNVRAAQKMRELQTKVSSMEAQLSEVQKVGKDLQ